MTRTDRPEPTPPALPGLTAREREVLAHLMAGGTNAEIAKTLVLSEKTISVHISNMLRKTGTTNRVQLAELARRHGARKSEED
ncbi:LuxR C-terminal-related transcriptional regulator [Actinoplanes sp. Pm04-4]|uniref:LuxR C-terminal-related transcriptional regulator n=1 Tax=Paractinoplanes pyxinae TaxID=2997416 RepID=A0ABT4AXE7_9ACTN|nr:LuxR C-terminal-related transcriptional regulator [Actinoplanes pyxinae]